MSSLIHLPRKILMAGVSLLLSFSSFAQSPVDVNPIIKEMFDQGNSNFMLVMAMQDGLIKEGQSYHFLYLPNAISLDGKVLAEPYQSRYMAMFTVFLSKEPFYSGSSYSSMNGDGFTMHDVLDPRSNIRKMHDHSLKSSNPYASKYIWAELTIDRLADTSKAVNLLYNKDGLTLNSKALSPAMDAKYKKLIAVIAGFEFKKDGDSYSMSR